MQENLQNSQSSNPPFEWEIEENFLDTRMLFMAFCMLFGTLVLFFPKIYLANNIYYLSKEIATLHTNKEILDEENKKLRRELEDITFQFVVRDNLP